MTAIVFNLDDTKYLKWMEDNPHGFVLNTRPSEDSSYLFFHESGCPHISLYTSTMSDGAFTRNDYIKICSTSSGDLVDWAEKFRKKGTNYKSCKTCQPQIVLSVPRLAVESESGVLPIEGSVQQDPLSMADQKWAGPVPEPAEVMSVGADSKEEVTIAINSIPPLLTGTIPHFVVGQEYSRRDEIHLNYGGSRQSGISSSAACPAIFLFAGDSGEQYGYQDDFDSSGVFSYTGEGQVGDMEFKAGNRSIRDHAADGRALYLFQSLGKGKGQQYLGEFVLANYSIRQGPDRVGNERSVIVFHLLRVDATQEAPASVSQPAKPISLDEARKKALAACSGVAGAAGTQAVRTVYERSKAIRDYVLLRAKGICQACFKPAPFLGTDAQPYLEAHHTTRLSDGGVDHPRHVAALCPTCHREIHYGQNGTELNKRLVDLLADIESIT